MVLKITEIQKKVIGDYKTPGRFLIIKYIAVYPALCQGLEKFLISCSLQIYL